MGKREGEMERRGDRKRDDGRKGTMQKEGKGRGQDRRREVRGGEAR